MASLTHSCRCSQSWGQRTINDGLSHSNTRVGYRWTVSSCWPSEAQDRASVLFVCQTEPAQGGTPGCLMISTPGTGRKAVFYARLMRQCPAKWKSRTSTAAAARSFRRRMRWRGGVTERGGHTEVHARPTVRCSQSSDRSDPGGTQQQHSLRHQQVERGLNELAELRQKLSSLWRKGRWVD